MDITSTVSFELLIILEITIHDGIIHYSTTHLDKVNSDYKQLPSST